MAAAANADDYAADRVGIFFTANGQTPADGDLTGQCVTLVKWFMQEMASVPNPFAARGDARYVGINLVAQGLADEIPAGQQRRGDIVVYEYGTYGHIGVLLSGNRFFQENANAAGAIRRVLADGTVVYSSTIVPLYPSLGGVAPKFYRLKSYKEGDTMTEEVARGIAKWGRLLGFNSVEKMNGASDDDVRHIMADPNYAVGLLEQLYKGEWQVPAWKANNYDANTKAEYQRGLKDGAAQGGSLPAGSYVQIDKSKIIEVK